MRADLRAALVAAHSHQYQNCLRKAKGTEKEGATVMFVCEFIPK
jgi:hypothetical protein